MTFSKEELNKILFFSEVEIEPIVCEVCGYDFNHRIQSLCATIMLEADTMQAVLNIQTANTDNFLPYNPVFRVEV
jgi:predicted Zn-ribbon and HTH transcriptional regulator